MRLATTDLFTSDRRNASDFLARRLIEFLVRADARYREACKLREMPDERLRDMGLLR